jgi:MFS transporter, putative metabolite:H+ symporter
VEKKDANAGARLDRLPISKFHVRMLFLVGGGMFFDAFEINLAAGVLGSLMQSGWSTMAQNAQFMSATFAGMVLGAWTAGMLGDRFGRRFTYQTNLLIFGLASLAGAAAPSMNWLIAARFIMGMGLGAEIVTGYVMLSEFVPPAQRGRWLAGLAAMVNSALLVAAAMGYLIIPTIGWRWMFIIVGVGALAVWLARKNMPESPRWLEARGRHEEADAILCNIEAEIAQSHDLPPPIVSHSAPAVSRPFMALFSRDLFRRTFLGALILIVVNTISYGFIAWIPIFMAKNGMSIVTSLGYATLMSAGGPTGALLGMWSGDRVGRKLGIIFFSTMAALLGALYPHVAEPHLIVLVGFGLVTAVYALVTFGFALYVPELFPTDLRMRGSGLCNSLGRMMTVLTPYLVVQLFAVYGISGVSTVMVALLVFQIIIVAIFGIETKGKSLEALAGSADQLSQPSGPSEAETLVQRSHLARGSSR